MQIRKQVTFFEYIFLHNYYSFCHFVNINYIINFYLLFYLLGIMSLIL